MNQIKTTNTSIQCLDSLRVRLAQACIAAWAPMCSPTRGQLLTGRDALRNGASIIASSRMMVRPDVPMMPAMFASAGYATALFGKWHLGENHPHRPQDRGFQETLWFPMQEISSLPDHWGNDYFDPVLRRLDGRTEKCTGYCTDILFRETMGWIQRQQAARKPFFCVWDVEVARDGTYEFALRRWPEESGLDTHGTNETPRLDMKVDRFARAQEHEMSLKPNPIAELLRVRDTRAPEEYLL